MLGGDGGGFRRGPAQGAKSKVEGVDSVSRKDVICVNNLVGLVFCFRRPVCDVVVSARPQFPALSPCHLDGCCFHIFVHHCHRSAPC